MHLETLNSEEKFSENTTTIRWQDSLVLPQLTSTFHTTTSGQG
jgi:hypothetical protein